jgi:hypothetical protein
MAVILVRERRGRSGGDNDQFQRQRRRIFRVLCDTKYQDETAIAVAPGIPPIKTPFFDPLSGVYDPGCVCVNRRFEQDQKNPKHWYVTCEFDTVTKEQDDDSQDDPERKRIIVNYPSRVTQKAFDKDKDGNQILLSNGLPPNPPLEREIGYWNIAITYYKKYANYTPSSINGKLFYVNSATWKGYAARTLLIRDVNPVEQYEKGFRFFEINVLLEYNPDTWDESLLNIGTHKKVAGQLPQPIKIGNVDVKEPHLLKADGTPDTTPTYTTKKIRKEVDFSTLDINAADVKF